MPTTVAVMQPYFAPYAGYFRLLAATDLFVIYDCVQFPRRGWVHRNLLTAADGKADWFTLPLAKAPRDVLIRDLAFADDAGELIDTRMRRFPAFANPAPDAALLGVMRDTSIAPADYVVRVLKECCERLRIPFTVICSTALDIDPALRGQDRVLEILRQTGAKRYLNAPGGRTLYAPDAFQARGIALRFLPEHAGSGLSILQRLLSEDATAISREILANIRFDK